MKKINLGILAHVDAGKTTLSEAILYFGGSIKNVGRVDNKDAFLDTFGLEKERGITIFSKQATITKEDFQLTLIDTPGHVDFSPEMERTLSVLDYAILVISAADGIQSHTLTLWKLLEKYHLPTFIFVNKMDQAGADKAARLDELKNRLGPEVIDFSAPDMPAFYEDVALCDEGLLEQFIETQRITPLDIGNAIASRHLFPCYFGSALRLEGVEELLRGLETYSLVKDYPQEFGAKVFKITRDEKGTRLTHLKMTGGKLRVKDVLPGVNEKINQLRLYSGDKYLTPEEAVAGDICAVTGPEKTYAGLGLGSEVQTQAPMLEPVLTYQMELPEGTNPHLLLPKLQQLEEESPELKLFYNKQLEKIQVQIMGEVQLQILQHLIKERLEIDVSFVSGQIVYKETITNQVEGVGHFEPLRHYAEVHLILEPGHPGSGMVYKNSCSDDLLDKNYQHLILKHLEEKPHVGVLTGALLTDVVVTLVSGKSHAKHTEGGDFRQATYRALRQGLMEANSLLLEPYYEFRLEVPTESVGRGIADIEHMSGTFTGPEMMGDYAVLKGNAPVSLMQGYQQELISYTKGLGKLFLTVAGFRPCHNQEEILAASDYQPEADLDNPPSSVFCTHGAGFTVPWNEVKDHMHLEAYLKEDGKADDEKTPTLPSPNETQRLGTEEVDAIISRTFSANKNSNKGQRKKKTQPLSPVKRTIKAPKRLDPYLLVDGYNVIHSWPELKELSTVDIGAARDKLLDILCNYQAIKSYYLIVVFDAYLVADGQAREVDFHNIHVVYTKEAETADAYIERFTHLNKKKYDITVATSDGMEQLIIRGADAKLISSRELELDVIKVSKEILEEYQP